MNFDNELEKITESPLISDLIELKIIDSIDNLSLSDYLLLWMIMRDSQDTHISQDQEKTNEQYIELNERITDNDYWLIKKRLEDNGFTILKVDHESEVIFITVITPKGKVYKFKIYQRGGVSMDDYEGNDFSDNENNVEDTSDNSVENTDSNTELIESVESPENSTDDKSSELVETKENGDDSSIELEDSKETPTEENENGVSPEVRAEINEKSSYSPEVNSYINSVEELEIYQKAGLEEVQINGRTCLIRSDIDMDQVVDDFGMTNADLIKEGYAPFDKNGHRIELHHIGQKDDAPLAELTFEEHRSSDTYSILHDTSKESEINRSDFSGEREAHWKSRS